VSKISPRGRDVFIFLLAVLSPPLLYYFRYYDDSRLTSWVDVAEVVSPRKVYIAIILGLFISYGLSVISYIPKRKKTFLFLISFAISSLFWSEPEVIIDASRYFTQAKHLELYGIGYFLRQWAEGILAWTDLPFIPMLYGIVFKIFGESRLYIQILNSLFMASSVLFLYLLGRDIWEEEVGLVGAMFLLGIPYLYTQVPLMLVDVAGMCFLIGSVLFFRRAILFGRLYLPLASVFISICLLTKYSLLPALSVLRVVLFIEKKGLRRAIFVISISLIIVLPIIIFKYRAFSEQIGLLLGYQSQGLGRWSESFLSIFLYQMHPFLALLGIASIYIAIRRRDIKYILPLWLVFLVFAFGIRRIRYIIPVFPMFSLMAGYGLSVFKDKAIKGFVVSSAVITSIVIGVFAYLPYLDSLSAINLKKAGAYIDSMHSDTIEVICHYDYLEINPSITVPLLDIYTKKKIIYRDSPLSLTKDFLTSPFRFTWLYKNPPYYEKGSEKPDILAVISDNLETIPDIEGYKVGAIFNATDNYIFQSKVKVFVFGD